VRLCSNLHYPIVQQDKGNSLLRAEPVVYRAVSIIFAYQSLPERIAAGKSIVTTKFSNPFIPSEAQQESGSTLLVPAQERKTLVK